MGNKINTTPIRRFPQYNWAPSGSTQYERALRRRPTYVGQIPFKKQSTKFAGKQSVWQAGKPKLPFCMSKGGKLKFPDVTHNKNLHSFGIDANGNITLDKVSNNKGKLTSKTGSPNHKLEIAKKDPWTGKKKVTEYKSKRFNELTNDRVEVRKPRKQYSKNIHKSNELIDNTRTVLKEPPSKVNKINSADIKKSIEAKNKKAIKQSLQSVNSSTIKKSKPLSAKKSAKKVAKNARNAKKVARSAKKLLNVKNIRSALKALKVGSLSTGNIVGFIASVVAEEIVLGLGMKAANATYRWITDADHKEWLAARDAAYVKRDIYFTRQDNICKYMIRQYNGIYKQAFGMSSNASLMYMGKSKYDPDWLYNTKVEMGGYYSQLEKKLLAAELLSDGKKSIKGLWRLLCKMNSRTEYSKRSKKIFDIDKACGRIKDWMVLNPDKLFLYMEALRFDLMKKNIDYLGAKNDQITKEINQFLDKMENFVERSIQFHEKYVFNANASPFSLLTEEELQRALKIKNFNPLFSVVYNGLRNFNAYARRVENSDPVEVEKMINRLGDQGYDKAIQLLQENGIDINNLQPASISTKD